MKDKSLDLANELKKLWNMQVTIIPIVIDAFGTVTKGLLEDLEVSRREETIQNHSIIENGPEMLRKCPGGLEETCCHSNSSEDHQLTLM